MMRRMSIGIGGIVTLLLAGATPAREPQTAPHPTAAVDANVFEGGSQDPRRLAMRAYVWGYPLVRAAQLRQNLTLPADPLRVRPPSSPGAAMNRFGHARELGSPKMRQGVAPNADTLYSLAWLDMDGGPYVLTAPDFGARYYTFQMGQADSSTRQSLGQRTHGGQLPPVFIQGPGQHRPVPAGMVEVRSSQRYLMIAGRTLVAGAADIPAVADLQRRIRLSRWQDYAARRDVLPPVAVQRVLRTGVAVTSPDVFLEMLGVVLRDWRPSAADRALVESFRHIGLSVRNGYRPESVTADARAAALLGVKDGESAVRRKTFALGRNVEGWSINTAGSVFGDDYLLRAAVAMDQIYVLPKEEALYPNARLDADGRVLDGRNSYTLRFANGDAPPVRFFWSVTMYHAAGLMVDNPIGRYAIGDRTPSLVHEPDGSIRIVIQNARPAGSDRVNWLPAPAGPFMLMMRLYGPGRAAQTGRWTPPAIVRRADAAGAHPAIPPS